MSPAVRLRQPTDTCAFRPEGWRRPLSLEVCDVAERHEGLLVPTLDSPYKSLREIADFKPQKFAPARRFLRISGAFFRSNQAQFEFVIWTLLLMLKDLTKFVPSIFNIFRHLRSFCLPFRAALRSLPARKMSPLLG